MDDLVQWLGEQLDEDERIARACPGDGAWDADGFAFYGRELSPEVRAHVVAHDPARVLREINAKRDIVDDLAEFIGWGARKGLDYQDGVEACERTLKRLALPYADRLEYREEWRP